MASATYSGRERENECLCQMTVWTGELRVGNFKYVVDMVGNGIQVFIDDMNRSAFQKKCLVWVDARSKFKIATVVDARSKFKNATVVDCCLSMHFESI